MINLRLSGTYFNQALEDAFAKVPEQEVPDPENPNLRRFYFFETDLTAEVDTALQHLVLLGTDSWKMGSYSAEHIVKVITKRVVETEIRKLGIPETLKIDDWSWAGWAENSRFQNRLNGAVYKTIFSQYVGSYDQHRVALEVFNDINTPGGVRLGHLNFVRCNKAGIDEVKTKCPGLYPFLGEYCQWRRNQFKLKAKTDPTVKKTDWSKPHNVFAEMRVFMLEKYGLTKSGWKVLLSINNEQKGKWLQNDAIPVGFATVLEAIGTHPKQRFPRVTAMRAIRHLTHRFQEMMDAPQHTLLKQLVLEALKHSTKAKHIGNWVSLEWDQVSDWFREAGHLMAPTADKHQLNAKWTWFVRHSQAWHDDIQARRYTEQLKRSGLENRVWASELETHTVGDFEFVPCLSSLDLFLEGREQDHCVGGGGYITRSLEGTTRIWSIRNIDGARVATLEINRNEHNTNVWHRGQLKGKRNSEVTPEVEKAADGLVKRYNQAIQDKLKAAEEAREWQAQIRAAAQDNKVRKQLERKLAKRLERQEHGLPVTIRTEEATLLEQMGIQHNFKVA